MSGAFGYVSQEQVVGVNDTAGRTRRIVDYSRGVRYEHLPQDVVSAAKAIVLDTLGALFAAWPDRHPAARIVGDYVADLGGAPHCTVFGRDFRAPAPQAALVNGLMGHAADIEGGLLSHPPAHAAAVLVPTGLVMSEWLDASGQDFIAALTLGYDVVDRVSKAGFAGRSYPHSFHPSAVYGTFGAVALAGHMLRLDERQFANAYGLAGNIAGGLIAWVYDPTEHSRPFGDGWAAHNGVMAALLAAKGFGGPQGVFDGTPYNIFDAYSGAMDLAALTRALGEDYAITRHDGFKKYPCCFDIHTGLDALLKIVNEHGLVPQQIASVTHKVKEDRRLIIDDNPLRSHNAQYIMAVAGVERTLRWDDFLKDRRLEPEIGRLYGRIRLVGADELAMSPHQEPAIVEVETTDGRVFSERVDVARGHALNPMPAQELEEKFLGFARPIVGEGSARQIVELVAGLEQLPRVGTLIQMMAGETSCASRGSLSRTKRGRGMG